MAPLTSRERAVLAFIRLEGVPGLGPRRIRRLWEMHGSAEAALDTVSDPPEEAEALGVLAEARRFRLRAIPLGDPAYPPRLLDLSDPPPVLYVHGIGWPNLERVVAIVGTRRCSAYGRRMARALARDLSRWGFTIVSGMAAGIDAEAHASSLDASGETIGVLGSGHAHEYPASNRLLYGRMRRNGWLVSEFAPRVRPFRGSFPRRNRIIAGLARAVIVVEAGGRSGALNTATHGADLGREIMAVPARAGDRAGVGTLRLLRDGAALVTDVRDVFDGLGWVHDDPVPEERPEGGGADAWVIEALGAGDLTANELATLAGRDVGATVGALGRLEIDGLVGRSADGTFHAREIEVRR